MQAYVANFDEEFLKIKEKSYIVYFSGCNFKCSYCNSSSLYEFKNEHLIFLKDLKKDIELNLEQIENIVFTGGEPTLQRQALLEIARFARQKKLKIVLETNGSKPEIINSLLKSELIDEIKIGLNSPLNEGIFEKITKSQTFFKMSAETIKDIKQTFSILRKYNKDITIITKIIPSLIFKKEDIIEIGKEIRDLNCIWIIKSFNPEGCRTNLKNISAPTKKFIETIKEICIKEFPKLIIQ